MALKMLLDSLDGVPESVQPFYQKTEDGKFRLELDGYEEPTGLKKALQSERTRASDLEKKLKTFDGIDPVKVHEWQSKLEDDEDFKLWQQPGGKELVRSKWFEKQRSETEKQLKSAADALDAEKASKQKFRTKVLDDSVRQAATAVGLHPHAIEDALFRARSIFTLDDDANAIQQRDGAVVLGKDGKTPFSPKEWLEGMREVAPHWYPATGTGGGSQQTRGSTGNGQQRQIKRAVFDGWSPVDKRSYLKEGGIVVD